MRVRRHVVERIWASEGRERERAIADLIFLHRGNPAAAAFWDWQCLGQVYADALRDGDREAILAMVERHEGAESAAIADALARAPARGLRRRSAARGAELLGLRWRRSRCTRPARRTWRAIPRRTRGVGARAAPRAAAPGGRGADRAASWSTATRTRRRRARFNVVTMRRMQEWLGRPRLSWYYIVAADPDAMAPLMGYIDFQRAPDADFEVGGRHYGVFARDWRRGGGVGWLELMAERELGDDAPAPARRAVDAAPQLALSQPEFADAVRRALRDLHRPDALAAQPARADARGARPRGRAAAPEALGELIGEAVDALRADPRGERLARALERTYLRPAPTQEAAAELLGLPFSTYRGHLTRGIERVVDWLWQRELYGAGAGAEPAAS